MISSRSKLETGDAARSTRGGTRWFVLAAAALTFEWLIYPLMVSSRVAFLAGFVDDAYYYFQVAQNVANGRGFSFDGQNLTNGFHWLWQTILIVIAFFVRSKEVFVYVVAVTTVVVVLLACWLLYRALARYVGSVAWIGLLPLFLSGFGDTILTSGMETSVLFLGSVLVFVALLPYFDAQAKLDRHAFLKLGGALLILVAARFDYVVFVPVVVLAVLIALYRRRLRIDWKGAGLALLPVFGFLLFTLLFNQLLFGHWMTISSAIKSSFSSGGKSFAYYLSLYSGYVAVALLSLPVTGYCWLLATRLKGQRGLLPVIRVMLWIAVGITIHVIGVLWLAKWQVFSTYFSAYVLFPMLFLALVAAILSSYHRLRRVTTAVAAIFAGVFVVVNLLNTGSYDQGFWQLEAYRAAGWADQNLPVDARIGAEDAGVLGFFSVHPVVNLDGVINNFAYQDTLRSGEFARYLCDQGINYYASNNNLHKYGDANQSDFELVGYSHVYDVAGGEVTLKADHLIYQSHALPYDGSDLYLIWRLDQDCGG